MLSNKEELKNKYNGIRSSSLHWFDVSPKYFKAKIDNILEEDKKSYFELGKKLHMFILEPEKFDELYVYLESDIPKSTNQKLFCEKFVELEKQGLNLDDCLLQAYKEAYIVKTKSDKKNIETARKILGDYSYYIKYLRRADIVKDTINRSTMKFLQEAKSCIMNHKVASELLLSSLYSTQSIDTDTCLIANELEILWEHPTIKLNNEPLVCRSALDRLVIDHTNKTIKLIDIKTTVLLHKFEERFEEFKYYRQLAFYWFAVYYLFIHKYPDKNFEEYTKETFVVGIQTVSNPTLEQVVECEVFSIGQEWLTRGMVELETILPEIIWHMENDKWEHRREYYEGSGYIKL